MAGRQRQVECPERAAERRVEGHLTRDEIFLEQQSEMSEIAVTLPDGSSRRVRAGSTARDVAAEVSPGLAKAALAATVDGRLVDLTYPLEQDAKVAIVTDRNAEALQRAIPTRPTG